MTIFSVTDASILTLAVRMELCLRMPRVKNLEKKTFVLKLLKHKQND